MMAPNRSVGVGTTAQLILSASMASPTLSQSSTQELVLSALRIDAEVVTCPTTARTGLRPTLLS